MRLQQQEKRARGRFYLFEAMHRLLGLVAVLYVGFLAGLFAIARANAALWWPLQLAEVFNPWFYLPLPGLMLVAWLLRSRRSGLLLALPLLFFAADYGSMFLPRVEEPSDVHLRVLTANLLFTNKDARSLGDLLRETRPDVVALQELGTAMSASLADEVRDLYPYQVLLPRSAPLGMGILSRYPIRDSAPSETALDCRCQRVTIDIGDRRVTVVNVHPDPPIIYSRRWRRLIVPTSFATGVQEQMVRAAEGWAMASSEPLLIMGDLNSTDREETYRILARRYGDTYREVGWGLGFTFPADRKGIAGLYPSVRIDYVFHDDSWTANDARVVDVPGSDHRAVLADVSPRRERRVSAEADAAHPRAAGDAVE